jgi:hypothetical protein
LSWLTDARNNLQLYRFGRIKEMGSGFLRTVANRCVAAARECSDPRAIKEFHEIAQQLLYKANELDGKLPPIPIRKGAPSDRKGDPD